MDTDARNLARRYYSCSARNLQADIAELALNPRGLIYWTPQLVVLAKPVQCNYPKAWAQLAKSPATADGWYVHLLTGDITWARRLAGVTPPLKWLCFQRGLRSTKLHVLPWHRILPH